MLLVVMLCIKIDRHQPFGLSASFAVQQLQVPAKCRQYYLCDGPHGVTSLKFNYYQVFEALPLLGTETSSSALTLHINIQRTDLLMSVRPSALLGRR